MYACKYKYVHTCACVNMNICNFTGKITGFLGWVYMLACMHVEPLFVFLKKDEVTHSYV